MLCQPVFGSWCLNTACFGILRAQGCPNWIEYAKQSSTTLFWAKTESSLDITENSTHPLTHGMMMDDGSMLAWSRRRRTAVRPVVNFAGSIGKATYSSAFLWIDFNRHVLYVFVSLSLVISYVDTLYKHMTWTHVKQCRLQTWPLNYFGPINHNKSRFCHRMLWRNSVHKLFVQHTAAVSRRALPLFVGRALTRLGFKLSGKFHLPNSHGPWRENYSNSDLGFLEVGSLEPDPENRQHDQCSTVVLKCT